MSRSRVDLDSEALVTLRKPLARLTAAEETALLQRHRRGEMQGITDTVAGIVNDVRQRGDDALVELAQRFDGVRLDHVEVPRQRWLEATEGVEVQLRKALQTAAEAIAAVHRAQRPSNLHVEVRPGVTVGRRSEALDRVGAYAPGGRAAYPSSVLMCAVPARVAGVREVLVCSPPGPDGLPSASVLAACTIAGVDRVFAIGGAGAIAAMAYGTATIPMVDCIVGPGNAYVEEAKRQVGDRVTIDCPAGPSELLVIADASADSTTIALEMLAQAEHDPQACVVLLSTVEKQIEEVEARLRQRLRSQLRHQTIKTALRQHGALLTVASIQEAVGFANRFAAEHLLLLVEEPHALLDAVHRAGSIFLGPGSSVVLGDYITGANHVLPTGGQARLHSGLGLETFLRWTTTQEVRGDAVGELARPAAILARAEGLQAHAAAVEHSLEVRQANTGIDDPHRPPAEEATAEPRPFLSRTTYRPIRLYDPDRTPCEIDLSDNTNRWGAAPSARQRIKSVDDEGLSRYPSVYGQPLKVALAEILGVNSDNIATGGGSDDLLDASVRAFCEPGDRLVYPEPTFSMISIFARMNAATPTPVCCREGFELPETELLDANGRLTYLCRPNNPTGTLWPHEVIDRLVAKTGGLILLDEAYIEFAEQPSLVPAAIAGSRLLVLRTLSKAYGLAGLRVGYAVGPAPLIAEVEKARGPYKLGALAEAAAEAALRNDRGWVEEIIVKVHHNRRRLYKALTDLGLETYPSSANFLLVKAPGSAKQLASAMMQHGVGVRPFVRLPGAGDCIRITIGPWDQMAALLDALGKVLEMP